ncbi:hypothetical protein SAMN04488515_0686 [Cognatiyoonia koreensis]|uniref:Lipoprotein n=1 Tax=Cognatiyoonia koreensis TaxID=364200 RepID=A0A1I0NKW1_9RHOB|nr:hypothetical protein [Cognatiyoonia koreensis]SEW02091.1 hypothetical protein SAMN04488515_0686 [Cognatiyoonia koreensis]
MRAALLPMLALAACAGTTVPSGLENAVIYEGVQTNLLEGDLVNFIVSASGNATREDAIEYAECAAAQYTLIRGFGFARHVRTTVDRNGGAFVADAIYTISPDLPRGSRTIDAEVTVANCGVSGIPTV